MGNCYAKDRSGSYLFSSDDRGNMASVETALKSKPTVYVHVHMQKEVFKCFVWSVHAHELLLKTSRQER